mgnify:CR=1 FL=1
MHQFGAWYLKRDGLRYFIELLTTCLFVAFSMCVIVP